jgi:hypothetical protein
LIALLIEIVHKLPHTVQSAYLPRLSKAVYHIWGSVSNKFCFVARRYPLLRWRHSETHTMRSIAQQMNGHIYQFTL